MGRGIMREFNNEQGMAYVAGPIVIVIYNYFVHQLQSDRGS